jgi:hypothetical protein
LIAIPTEGLQSSHGETSDIGAKVEDRVSGSELVNLSLVGFLFSLRSRTIREDSTRLNMTRLALIASAVPFFASWRPITFWLIQKKDAGRVRARQWSLPS